MKRFMTILLVLIATGIPAVSQQLMNYSGSFNKTYLYMADPIATYTYYTNDDDERIYDGNFELKFKGEGYTYNNPNWGYVKGRFQNDIPVGDWIILYPLWIDKEKYYYLHFKCSFISGVPEGPAEFVVTTSRSNGSTGNIVAKVTGVYRNGLLDGDFSLESKYKGYMLPADTKGKFNMGKKIGKWIVKQSDSSKLVVIYNNSGYPVEGYYVNPETGDKSYYAEDISDSARFLGIDLNNLVDYISTLRPKRREMATTVKDNVPIQTIQVSTSSSETSEPISVAVEQPAEFPGGQTMLMKWLSKNVRYPESAQQNGIIGRVIVKFVVEKDGSIRHPSIVEGINQDLDQEAIRVVSRMPRWQAARNHNTPVTSYYYLPITFRASSIPTES